MAVPTVCNHVNLTQHINLNCSNEDLAGDYKKRESERLFGIRGAINSREFTHAVLGKLCESLTFPDLPP